jgi:6-phosphogluconolactonase
MAVLYAGSYAAAGQPGIHTFSFDTATGALTPRGSVAGIAAPAFIVAHPHQPRLYAVSEMSRENGMPGAVWSLRREQDGAPPEPINSRPSGGDFPCHLALDAGGRWLVVSNYGTGSVSVLPILAGGALGETTDLVQHQGRGPHPERQAGPHAHSAAFTPDNRAVIVADLGIDALLVYRFDARAGRLAAQARINTRPGAGPRHMAWHPGRPRLYVANELDSTVAVYAYDAAAGELHEIEIHATVPRDAPQNWVADIHVAPAGDRVYVSNRGHDSVASFSVAADGRLTGRAVAPCGGRWPRHFALAPGGRFLVAANQHSDRIAVLPLRGGVVATDAPVATVPVPGVSCVQFSAS